MLLLWTFGNSLDCNAVLDMCLGQYKSLDFCTTQSIPLFTKKVLCSLQPSLHAVTVLLVTSEHLQKHIRLFDSEVCSNGIFLSRLSYCPLTIIGFTSICFISVLTVNNSCWNPSLTLLLAALSLRGQTLLSHFSLAAPCLSLALSI